MGTNYYLYTTDKLIKEYTDNFSIIDYYNESSFGYEIHLCKLSCGWAPLFQRHKKLHSFNDLEKLYIKLASGYIVDEYGEKFDLDAFKEIVLNHSNVPPEYMRFTYDPNHKLLRTVVVDDVNKADLVVPFRHNEYERKYNEVAFTCNISTPYKSQCTYYEDPEYKIDWVDSDFS